MEIRKLASARIEPLDNGYIISGVGLAEDQRAAQQVDNNVNSVFQTWDEAAAFLKANIASPQDIRDIKERIRAKREEGLVKPVEANVREEVVN